MRFRRKQSEDVPDPTPATPAGPGATDDGSPGVTTAADAPETAVPAVDRPRGPWDASEVDLEEEDQARVDLGGLMITGRPGLELRMQVDEATQQIASVLLVGPEGAVELRAFAAPRNTDIWDDVRRQIAAETARRGGTATEAAGPYGKELRVLMPVRTPDGKAATQPSRVVGVSGPRWLLRATFLGRPAIEPAEDGLLERALRDVVVVRGNGPMAPGDPLPLVMPPNARPLRRS